MDAKRQNKLLKLAIGRLQNEIENKNEENGGTERQTAANNDGKTFLTENQQQQPEQHKADKLLEMLRGEYNGTASTAMEG